MGAAGGALLGGCSPYCVASENPPLIQLPAAAGLPVDSTHARRRCRRPPPFLPLTPPSPRPRPSRLGSTSGPLSLSRARRSPARPAPGARPLPPARPDTPHAASTRQAHGPLCRHPRHPWGRRSSERWGGRPWFLKRGRAGP